MVCVSVGHNHEQHKNGRTNRGAIWGVDLGGSKEQCIRWGSRSPMIQDNGAGNTWAWPDVLVVDTFNVIHKVAVAMWSQATSTIATVFLS